MYVVAGATGNTGTIVAERLLAEGKAVRAWVRSEAKGGALKAKGAELAVVDLDDAESVRAGLEGAEAAYLLLPPARDSEDFLALQSARAQRLVDAARSTGVEHLVLLSSVGAQHPDGTGVIRVAHDLETRVRASGIAHTFVRAAYFQENWRGMLPIAASDGILPQMLGDGQRAIPMVATEDIGRVAARALLDRSAGVIELEGPARYAAQDVAAVAAGKHGREVTVVDVPFEAQEAQLQSFGLSADLAALMREMNEGIARGRVDFEGGAGVRHLRGARSIADTLG